MRHRLIIALTICAVLGFYAQQAFAAGCSEHQSCMPPSSPSHTSGTGDQGCGCPPVDAQLSSHSCQPSTLVQRYQRAILNPAFQHPEPDDASFSYSMQDNIAPTSHAGRSPHGLKINEPPLSYPIYLQTLALLC